MAFNFSPCDLKLLFLLRGKCRLKYRFGETVISYSSGERNVISIRIPRPNVGAPEIRSTAFSLRKLPLQDQYLVSGICIASRQECSIKVCKLDFMPATSSRYGVGQRKSCTTSRFSPNVFSYSSCAIPAAFTFKYGPRTCTHAST